MTKEHQPPSEKQEVELQTARVRLFNALEEGDDKELLDAFSEISGIAPVAPHALDAGAMKANEQKDMADLVLLEFEDEDGELAYERALICLDHGDREGAALKLIKALRKDTGYRHTPLYRKLEDEVTRLIATMSHENAQEKAEALYNIVHKRLLNPKTADQIEEAAELFAQAVALEPEYLLSPLGRKLAPLLPPAPAEQQGSPDGLLELLPNQPQESPDYRKRLKELREDLGLSHAKMGHLLGVSKLTVLRWEDEKKGYPPSQRHAKGIQELFHLYERVDRHADRAAAEELAQRLEAVERLHPSNGKLDKLAAKLRQRATR